MTPQVLIYTDGACSGNPGPGGWGAVMISKGHAGHPLNERADGLARAAIKTMREAG